MNPSRAKLLSASLAAAAGLCLVWWSWQRASSPPRPTQRTAFSFEVRWLCASRHEHRGFGAAGAQPCPACGGDSFPSFDAVCQNPACGQRSAFQLQYGPSGGIEGFRWFSESAWTKYEFPPRCGGCGGAMRPL